MVPLLAILALGLAAGKLTRRITPAVELVLLLLIAGIVLVDFLSWSGGEAGSSADFLRGLITGGR
jgi:hypothetical protein